MSKSFRLGIFVVFALLSLSAGIFLIGNKEFLFSPTYRLKADFQNVGGLDNGA
jgi:ABC-type transporter Mla subunit MlaD